MQYQYSGYVLKTEWKKTKMWVPLRGFYSILVMACMATIFYYAPIKFCHQGCHMYLRAMTYLLGCFVLR